MTNEPKIQAAIDAALNLAPEDPAPNPKREVPMPDTFTRVEDFLNTPLFVFKKKNQFLAKWRPSPGALLNIVSCLAGLATISAALYWYASAKRYQELSVDLAGALQIAYKHEDGRIDEVADAGLQTTGPESTGLAEEVVPVSLQAGSPGPAAAWAPRETIPPQSP